MERAGIDIITDGEIRRESYSNRFATALDGIDARQSRRPCAARRAAADAGAARRRPDPPQRPGRGARRRVPARQHRPPHQDHAARPVHDVAAGPERILQGRGGAGDGLRRGGQRRGARPEGGRRRRRSSSTSRGCRRGPTRRGATALRRSTARSTASPAPTALHLCFGYAHVVRDKPDRLRVPGRARRHRVEQISIEAAQPKLDLGDARRSSPARRSCSACIDLGDPKVGNAAKGRRAASARRSRTSPAERLVPAPDCGMKYLPRDIAFAQTEGARRRRRHRPPRADRRLMFLAKPAIPRRSARQPAPERAGPDKDFSVLDRERGGDLRLAVGSGPGQVAQRDLHQRGLLRGHPVGGDERVQDRAKPLDPAGKGADRLQIPVERERAVGG